MVLNITALQGDDLSSYAGPLRDNRATVTAIQAQAGRCSDGVPFVLAPVRIETRFDRTELPRASGVTATSELAAQLAAAAGALENLAGADFRTQLPAGTAARKEYKRGTEDPLIRRADDALDELARALDAGELTVRDVAEAPEADVRQAEDAMRRLGPALPAARISLARLRSAYHRDRLLARRDELSGRAQALLATAQGVVRPAAEIFAALRNPAARPFQQAQPAGPAPRLVFAVPAGGRVQLARMRVADSGRAYAALREALAELARLAGDLAAAHDREPVRAHQLLLATGGQLLARVTEAQAHCTDIALLPAAWKAELEQQVADVAGAVRSATTFARQAAGPPGPASLAAGPGEVAGPSEMAGPVGVAPAFQLAGELNRLTDAVAALATDGPLGPTQGGLAVTPQATTVVDVLRVRIFPDDLAVITHEEPLTEAELAAGTTYWTQGAAGGGDEQAYRDAWRALVAKHGPRRAAWVALQTRPEQPASPDPALAAGLSALQVLDRRLAEAAVGPVARLPSLLTAAEAAAAAVAGVTGLPAAGLARLREQAATVTAKVRGLRERAAEAGSLAQQWDGIERSLDQLGGALAAAKALQPDVSDGPAAAVPTRLAAWTQPPRAGVLPDRFVVVTVSGDKVSHVVAGTPVQADLTLGLDPREENAEAEAVHLDADGRLVVGESLRWMVDYGVAETKGMAITVPITPAEAVAGFGRVYVLGLSGDAPDAGATRLRAVLDNHHYGPTGLGLLPVGTPTNSTDLATSAYRSADDPDTAFDIEQRDPLVSAGSGPADASDGWRLAVALGLPAEVFGHVAHADGRDIAEAFQVAAALWPATFGYALEELLGELAGVDAQDRLRRFGTGHVLGRGWLPTLRVGPQPYGMLVSTALSRYVPDGGNTMPPPSATSEPDRQRRFLLLLRNILAIMNQDWTAYREAWVTYAHRPGVTDPQQQVLEMLGLDSGGLGFEHRLAVNVGRPGAFVGLTSPTSVPSATSPVPQHITGPYPLLERFAEVIRLARALGPGDLLVKGQVGPVFEDTFKRLLSSRGYEVRYLTAAQALAEYMVPGPVTDPVPSTAVAAAITALLAATPEDLARNAAEQPQQQSLLVLLLRQALLVQARDTALRIAVREGLATPDIRSRIGSGDLFRVLTLAGERRVSRWSYLLAPLTKLNGVLDGLQFPVAHGSLGGYLTTNWPGDEKRFDDYLAHRGDNPVYRGFPAYRGTPASPNPHEDLLTVMRDHATAVGALAGIPPGRLDQLIREHLDTCSYRLDAWLLGFAHQRLNRMRATTPLGVYLGAFGWLDGLTPNPPVELATGVPAVLDTDPRTPIHADRAGEGFVHAPSLNHAVAAAVLRAGYVAQAPAQLGASETVDTRMAVNLSSRRVRTALDLLDGIAAGNDLGALLGYQFERDLHEAFTLDGVELDALIAPLRQAFPSVAQVDPHAAAASGANQQVVDGLRLLTVVREWVALYRTQLGDVPQDGTLLAALRAQGYLLYPYGVVTGTGGTQPAGTSLLPPVSEPARLDAALQAIDRLADTVDALGDLVLAEGVYQLVGGNHVRAGAALAAFSEGRLPDRPEVVDTPVTGIRVSHRVLLHFEPVDGRAISPTLVPDEATREAARQAALPAGWADLPMTARAAAEPTVNRWFGELLGPPGATRVAVVNESGAWVADVSLRALRVQPVDLVASVRNGFEDGLAELSARVLDTLRPIDVRDGEPAPVLAVSLERQPGWPPEVRSLPETAALLESLATLTAHWRSAGSADYLLADTAAQAAAPVPGQPPAGPDCAELATRAVDAVAALTDLGRQLLGLLSDGADTDPALLDGNIAGYVGDHSAVYRGDAGPGQPPARLDALWLRRFDLRTALLDATGFGITGVTPPARWTSRAQVAGESLAAAETAVVQVAARLGVARDWLAKADAAADPSPARAEALRRGVEGLFGESLTVLPQFRLANPDEVATAANAELVPDPAVAIGGWLQSVAPVRATLGALSAALSVADAFGVPPPAARPAQLPVREGEPWVAGSWPASAPGGDRLSLVLLRPEHLPPAGEVAAAALVDAWSELVPSGQVTTGLTFNYDQPDAQPPQTLLVAVPPQQLGHWRWEDLLQTLHDTYELAKNRAVEPQHLRDDVYGQLLPGLLGEIAPLGGGGLADFRVVMDFGYLQPPAAS